MSTVFLVQDTKWVDPKDGQLKSKFDFSAAEKYGKVRELLAPRASPFDLTPVIERLQHELSHYTVEDFLLLVGSPVLIGLAVAIAADNTSGQVNMLQWSGAKRCYIPARAYNIFPDC